MDKTRELIKDGERKNSWQKVKIILSNKDKPELIELIADLYSLNTTNKNFIYTKYSLTNPIELYKEIIRQSLYPDIGRNMRLSLSKAKKAISEYRKASNDPNGVIELMVYYVECGNQFTVDCGDVDEQFYYSIESMFTKIIEMLPQFDKTTVDSYLLRLENLVEKAKNVGWGYYDYLVDVLSQVKETFPTRENKYLDNFKL